MHYDWRKGRAGALEFAEEWIAAWNSHDLNRILSHYSGNFEMTSPFIAKLCNEPSGRLKGRNKVGEYWRKSLTRMPDLRFELLDVIAGASSLTIYYKSVLNLSATEVLFFDEQGKVFKAAAHYNELLQL